VKSFSLFSLLLLCSIRLSAQWDTLTYEDGKIIKERIFASSSAQLPRLFVSLRVITSVDMLYVWPRVGMLSIACGKYIEDVPFWTQADGMLFLFNWNKAKHTSLELESEKGKIYKMDVDGIQRTAHFGLHAAIANKDYFNNVTIVIDKGRNRYEVGQFSVFENAVGLGMICRKGLICGILRDNSTVDNASIEKYCYRMTMMKITADLLYYDGFRYTVMGYSQNQKPIQASDLPFEKYGWRIASTFYWNKSAETTRGKNYFGFTVEFSMEEVLQGEQENGFGSNVMIGFTYCHKRSFKTNNDRFRGVPQIIQKHHHNII
jgi:hypothetical protein